MTPFSYHIYRLGGYVWEYLATIHDSEAAIHWHKRGYKVFKEDSTTGLVLALEYTHEGMLL